jgi:hypothetical protein
MQLTFAGTVIAQEPTEGGTDAVTGFMPKRHATVQWAEFLRSTDATPLARLNRKRSLSGTIVYGPFSTLSSAAQKLLLNYDALPDSGPLVLLVGGINTSFGVAVLESVEAKQRMGVTVSATLTFQVGPGTSTGTSDLQDQDGNNLTDQSGNPLADT